MPSEKSKSIHHGNGPAAERWPYDDVKNMKYACILPAAFPTLLTAESGCPNQAGYSPFVLLLTIFIMPGSCVPGFFLPGRATPPEEYLCGGIPGRISRVTTPALNLFCSML
ncbi:hypothetical protein PQY08_004031 [Salmonella enterica]|nr:hypothetical protein [Salmonella enterica]EJG3781471.1 hypothetical protein [Salmonella enterica]EJM0404690.1 hypothetical protein [Salmonella enterica]EKH2727584.1 hypothetical protein [Salmonella enterica]EKL1868605.1 hypothetical protein [Salmonella enterica]